MNHSTGELISTDGIQLFTQSWLVKDPVADLFLVHGMAEHSSRYQYVAEILNQNHINVHALDLRGHGHSEGERAYCKSFDEFIEDVHTLVQNTHTENRNYFILGHSMGGLTAVNYLIKYPDADCKGLILSAPLLKIGEDTPPLLVKFTPIIASLFPKLKAVKLDIDFISRKPETLHNYRTDPLIYRGGIHARLGYEMIKYILKARENYPSFSFPVLLMHGTGDKLVDPQGSQWMHDEIQSKDKTLKLFPELYHELLNEPERDEVIDHMIKWIIARS